MKFLPLLFCLSLNAQFTVNVVRITPSVVCAGDTIRVNYSVTYTALTGGTHPMVLQSSNYPSFTYNVPKATLVNRPQETWSAVSPTQYYFIKMVVPANWYGALNCNFTNSTAQPFTTGDIPPPFSSQFSYCSGSSFYAGQLSTNTSTLLCPVYVSPPSPTTYSVIYSSQGCERTFSFVVSPSNCSGIEEQGIKNPEPVYYNLFGERTVKRANTVLIDGKRKVIYLSEN